MASDPRARLRWKCRRGMREMDLLLQRFVDREYDRLDASGRKLFERLLERPDVELLDYLYGRRPLSRPIAGLMERLRKYT